jgi:predicted TIM-barrel fold metal-dependent hydrolase
MLYATDFPMWDPKKCLDEFMSLNLSDDENNLILHKNAKKILKIKERTK